MLSAAGGGLVQAKKIGSTSKLDSSTQRQLKRRKVVFLLLDKAEQNDVAIEKRILNAARL